MRVCPFDEEQSVAFFRSAAALLCVVCRDRAAVKKGVGWDACNVRVRIDVDMYKMYVAEVKRILYLWPGCVLGRVWAWTSHKSGNPPGFDLRLSS